MHYLRWDHSITLRGLCQAGLDYDHTLGYADRPGFRCGTCFEYPALDPLDEDTLNIRVRPLILMDDTLLSEKYLGASDLITKLSIAQALKESCKMVGGQFSLLWHNSNLISKKQRQLLIDILSC